MIEEIAKFVVVALVEVELIDVRFARVDEAFTMTPIVVVGTSAPLTTDHVDTRPLKYVADVDEKKLFTDL